MSMSTSLDEMTQTIDTFINESIQEFAVMNNIQDSKYINTELEQELRNFVMESVSGRISINLLNKLRLFYKEDIIPDLIAKKIFLAVTAYTAINNTGATNKKINNFGGWEYSHPPYYFNLRYRILLYGIHQLHLLIHMQIYLHMDL